jgi:hypothetical protein
MKRIAFIAIGVCISLMGLCQSYLGWTIKQVNFRESPSTDAPILSSLQAGTNLFLVSLDTENGFYNVIDIETNTEGYVHMNFVKVGKEVSENDQGIFTPTGETSDYNPDVEIFNNTDLTLTLKLNSQTYYFSSYEKRTLTLSPGKISYRASAPGVIPNIGTEEMKNNQAYTWEFYIVTRHR